MENGLENFKELEKLVLSPDNLSACYGIGDLAAGIVTDSGPVADGDGSWGRFGVG